MGAREHDSAEDQPSSRLRSRRGTWAAVVVALWTIAIVLRIHNALSYPLDGTYDARMGHLPYIKYVKEHWRQPPADANWEAWQPPLYYWIAAGLWASVAPFSERPDDIFSAPQSILLPLLSSCLSLLTAWITARVVRRLLPDDPLAQLLSLALVLFWPMHVMLAAWVRNDLPAIVLCSAAMAVLLRADEPAYVSIASGLLLGLLVGLSLLAKYTGASILATAMLTLLMSAALRPAQAFVALRTLCLTLFVAGCVAGWFYVRHWLQYGKAFITSHDLLGSFDQPPGTRTLGDYLWFTPSVLWHPWVTDPSVIRSVWAGTYATAWFDGQYIFLNHYMPRQVAEGWGRLLLVLGFLPTLSMIHGAARAGALALGARRLVPYGALLALGIASVAAYARFTAELPYYSVVKAHFLLPATVPFGVFLALGTAAAPRWLRVGLSANMAALVLTVTVVFWFGLIH